MARHKGGRWPVLGHLKRAVKKIRFVLSYNARRWRHLSSIIAAAVGRRTLRRRPLSFNDRLGLQVCTEEAAAEESARPVRRLERLRSYGCDEDIDRRAEIFIENFYRQLRLERQISLEVRYYRGNSSQNDGSNSTS